MDVPQCSSCDQGGNGIIKKIKLYWERIFFRPPLHHAKVELGEGKEVVFEDFRAERCEVVVFENTREKGWEEVVIVERAIQKSEVARCRDRNAEESEGSVADALKRIACVDGHYSLKEYDWL